MVDQCWRSRFEKDWRPQTVNGYDEFANALGVTDGTSAILFASYDTLKRFHTHDDRRRRLLGALQFAYRVHRIRLKSDERDRLLRAVVPHGGAMPRRPLAVDEAQAVRMLKVHMDPSTRDWRERSHPKVMDFLDTDAGRSLEIHPAIDLLIVDEAHKLEGARRGSVVADAVVSHAWAGLYEMTPDAMPIIGPAAGCDGLYVIAGFSGHGFQHSPAAERVLSDLIAGRDPGIDLSPFACDRFVTVRRRAERHFV